MKKVLYEELLPEECVQRIKEMPVAYLPLGTLEWHGPHMPLGAEGQDQSRTGRKTGWPSFQRKSKRRRYREFVHVTDRRII